MIRHARTGKRLISLLLTAAMMSLLLPVTVLAAGKSGTTADGFEWNVVSSGLGTTVAITGYSGSGGNITIPEIIEGGDVMVIGDKTFQSNAGITGVTIPDSVDSVGKYAFEGCAALAAVTLGRRLLEIGDDAFANCPSLAKVMIFSRTTTMGTNIFASTGISGHSGMGIYGFSSSTPETYANSNNIDFHVLHEGTTDGFTWEQTSDTEAEITGYSGSGNMITIPSEADGLTVTAIAYRAFQNNKSFYSVTIPDSVTSIGGEAFVGTSLLLAKLGDGLETIGDGVFADTGLITATLGSGLKTIGNYAFVDCDELKSIDIPDSVTSIGEHAFDDCGALTSIVIPDSVTAIGDQAFKWCRKLAAVTLGSGLETIGEVAFQGTAITEITIPDSVTAIGNQAFSNCKSLQKAVIYSDNAVFGSEVFGISGIENNSGEGIYGFSGSTAETYAGVNSHKFNCIYTVTLNTNGGASMDAAYVLTGENLSKPSDPTRTGYTFAGWYTDEALSTGANFPMSVTGNATLYAKWTPVTYTIHYDANGGEGSMANTSCTYGTAQALAANVFTYGGYIFAGWAAASDGGVAYSDGQSVTNLATAEGEAVTLYAVWATYTITASAGSGGSISPSGTVSVAAGGNQTFAVTANDNYSISTVTVDSVSQGAISSYTFADVSGNHTITATFTYTGGSSSSSGGSATTYYTITATANEGGSISPSGSASVTYGSDKTFTVAAAAGYEIADVLVDGVSVDAVSSYLFKNVKKAHTITAVFKKTKEEAVNPFSDVNTGDWFYDNVLFTYKNGLMNGTTSDTFNPGGTMTRAMFVTVLYRLSGDAGSYTNAFSDVPSGAWYENAVAWAAANGITGGVGDNCFGPDLEISREQMAVMLYNYAKCMGYDATQGGMAIREYDDYESIAPYATEAMTWAVNAGLMQGSYNKLMPQDSATRAEAAAILQRFIENVAG